MSGYTNLFSNLNISAGHYDEEGNWVPDETASSEQPAAPAERRYDYLTGEQFFSDAYSGLGDQWFTPFYDNGQYGLQDLASMYAGIPVVSGYYDEEGNFVPEQSLYNQASQLYNLRNIQPEGFQDWMASNYPEGGFTPDLTQTAEYQGIQDLINQLTGAGQTETDMGSAEAQAALMQGYVKEDGTPDVEAYRAAQQQYTTGLDQGIMGQQGVLGTEYETLSRRAHAVEVQRLIESNQRIVEALGTKSSAAAYTKLAEVSGQIADVNVQYELKLAEQDLMMRQLEYEAMSNRLQQMQAQGLAIQEQYLTQLQNNRYMALQAYAQNLTAVIETNQNYFTMYGQYIDTMKLHADIVYQSIMADVGVNQAAMELANEAYEAYMAPYLDALDAWYMQQQVELAQGDSGLSLGGGLTGAVGGAFVGNMIVPGVGAVVGGIIGFFAGLFS